MSKAYNYNKHPNHLDKYIELTLARAVYISVDPFSLKSIFPRTVDRILHEIIFATSVSLFLVLLLVWHGLYTAFDIDRYKTMNKGKRCSIWRYEKVHTIIIVILFLIYPIQITFSYFRGARGVRSNIVDAVLIAIMSVVISFIIIFFIYTCRFKIIISQSTEAPIKNQIKEMKKTMYTNRFTYTSNIEINDQDMMEFFHEAEIKGNLYLIKKYIIDVENEHKENELTDYDMELEDEFINLDLNYNNEIHHEVLMKKHDEHTEDEENVNRHKAPVKKAVSLASVRDSNISLKKNDINVLNKVNRIFNQIFGLSYLIIAVGIMIIIIGLILYRTNILDNPNVICPHNLGNCCSYCF
jgi:hypothetical protein